MISVAVKFASYLDVNDIERYINEINCTKEFLSVSGWYYVAPQDQSQIVTLANYLLNDTKSVSDVCLDEYRSVHSFPDDEFFFTDSPPHPMKGQWELYTPTTGLFPTPPSWVDSCGVQAYEAWEDLNWEQVNITEQVRPIIAIYDANVDINHPDLFENWWRNPGEYGGQDNVDDDGNGYVDDIYAVNVSMSIGRNPDSTIAALSMKRNNWHYYFQDHSTFAVGHGTTVCGAAGAKTNNGIGLASVASGWGNNKGASVMFLTSRHVCSSQEEAQAIAYAIENGARIFSISVGWRSRAVQEDIAEAFDNHNLLTFSSIGNHGVEPDWIDNDPEIARRFIAVGMTDLVPESYQLDPNIGNPPGPLQIGEKAYEVRCSYVRPLAPGEDGGVNGYKMFASDHGALLDMMAPRVGCQLVDTYINPGEILTQSSGASSQSSPLAASIAAMVLAAHPSLTPQELMQILLESCTKLPGRPNSYFPIHSEDIPDGHAYPSPHEANYGDPNYYIPGEHFYNDVNLHNDQHGSWDEQMGHGRIDAKKALWYAQNRAQVLGPPDPAANLNVASSSSLGMLIDWDASSSMDVQSYTLRRYSRFNNEYETIDIKGLTDTQWYDSDFYQQSGGSLDPKDYCDYTVWAVDESGYKSSGISMRVYVDGTIGSISFGKAVGESNELSYDFKGAFPNPFNLSTQLSFSIPFSGSTSLKVYSIDGRLVETIMEKDCAAGDYKYTWETRYLSSGLYLVEFNSGNYKNIKKVILVK